MAAIYHPGVVAVVPHYNIGRPTNAVNVTYWSTAASGLTVAQLTVVQTAFDTAWSGYWHTYACSLNSYVGSIVTDMSSNTGAQAGNATYVPVIGAGAATSIPDNCAILMSLKTSTRYRGGKGRLYIPGQDSLSVMADGRTVVAGRVTQFQNLWTNVVSAMSGVAGSSGGPYNPIVWHKKLRTNPNTTEAINSVVVSNILASQRRRLRKVPHH